MSDGLKLEPATEAALLAAYGTERPIAEAARRDKKERAMSADPNDGRRLRATGRTTQFNVNMKPDVKTSIQHAAKRAGIPVTVWIERAALAYMAKGEGHGKSRHISAYALAGIPAVIGVAFVARFAYVTSDTAIDGAANAFMFGMIAAGAFAGPAIALAVAGNGRKGAACALGILALLAAIMNWSHTLGAIAHRGAGQAAQSAKASADQADARAELVRITAERSGMTFTPTTKETVDAARAAVAAAERVRSVECEERRNRCRERETQEQAKRDALTMILQAKAATDQAAQLDAEAAAIRARLAVAAPVRETNPLGAALGRLLAVSAVTAATWQQAIVSGIAELLIAAALALPELLRQGRPEARQELKPCQRYRRPDRQPSPPRSPPGGSASLVASRCWSCPSRARSGAWSSSCSRAFRASGAGMRLSLRFTPGMCAGVPSTNHH